MKYLRIAYTKLIMLDVEDDFTEEDASALVDEIAEDDWDEVEWEITEDGWSEVAWDIESVKEG